MMLKNLIILLVICFISTKQIDIDDLLNQMDNEDKCGQMTQIEYFIISDKENDLYRISYEKLVYALREKRVGSIIFTPAEEAKDNQIIINMIQAAVLNETKLKIPIIYGIDSTHGNGGIKEGVLFPQPLAQASSFNLNIAYKIGEITSIETRTIGTPWNFYPVLDIGRQPLWPRLYETYGEDVYLVSKMGDAYIRGQQGNDLKNKTKTATCLKHYLGYSFPFNGLDRGPAYIPDNLLREVFLPPFQAGIEAGAETVMLNSAEVNGIPGHANSYYINDILKGELNFKGFVLSDWQDVKRLYYRDKVADSPEDAVRIAVMSGLDMSMVPNDYSFFDYCVNLTRKDEKFLERVNDAVRRILRVKEKLGLFEDPFVSEKDLDKIGTQESEEFNLQAARESIILAKNTKNILPLKSKKIQKILVTGPTGNILRTMNSGWSYSWQGDNEDLYRIYGRVKYTIFEAMQKKHSNIEYKQGVYFDSLADDFEDTIETASNSDIIVLCIGEEVYAETPGNIKNLMITEPQIKLADALFKLNKTVIVVYTAGRPRIMTNIAKQADSILIGFLPGSRGGEAIADIIFGDYNPNGRMPISYPMHTNGFTTYDYKPVEIYENTVEFLYPFGHGLSYTKFEYNSLYLNTTELNYDDKLLVKVNVKNVGDFDGKETVILYLNDEIGSVSRPLKQMKRFDKIDLKSGETKQVEFVLNMHDLSFIGRNSKRIVEPGKFNIYISNLTSSFYLKI